ncbi:hypothetical protein TNCV_3371481 [Trichonephila clavipes]|nr:hypothetical protein TNCV_3371481 [Trichonephila clavipes]
MTIDEKAFLNGRIHFAAIGGRTYVYNYVLESYCFIRKQTAIEVTAPPAYEWETKAPLSAFIPFQEKAKVVNILGSLHMPRDWAQSGHSFPWLSKTLRSLGHGSIFVNVCGDDALCSSGGQGNFRLSRLRSLLAFLVGSFVAGDPNMT